MATIINNPDTGDRSGSGGLVIAVVVAIIVLFLFFYYGLPAMRNGGSDGTSDTNINVPDKVDVNVNEGGSGQ